MYPISNISEIPYDNEPFSMEGFSEQEKQTMHFNDALLTLRVLAPSLYGPRAGGRFAMQLDRIAKQAIKDAKNNQ